MSSFSRLNLEKYLIPLEEIHRATENFSTKRRIGGGGFGTVYEGQLSERWENRTAAIKRLDPDSYQGEREFRTEIEMIPKLHHENVIAFIGYCDQVKEMIIVYEYAINGSLDHHLQNPNKMCRLTWVQRLQICAGAARGLDYLHSGLGEHDRVIHRDVKSANILLDGNLVAKVCDFGLSKVGPRNQHDTQLNTNVAGTHFYMDPTYNESRILRKESDVYSFGVVLFEMLSGMLVYHRRNIDNQEQLLMHSIRRYHQNEPHKLIDPYIRDHIHSRTFSVFKEIAYRCISFDIRLRPPMETVINDIEEALVIQTSRGSICTPEERSDIESLLIRLNSASPYDQGIAAKEILNYFSRGDNYLVVLTQCGAIPLLTGLLIASDRDTQERGLRALEVLSYWKGNIELIMLSGAVPRVVHLLVTGSLDAQGNAAVILANLCKTEENTVTIDAAVAIPPLLLLLSESDYSRQMHAIAVLFHLCKYQGDTGTTVRAGVVLNLVEFLTEEGLWIEKALELLTILSSHPEGRLAIRKEAVPLLIEFLGIGSPGYNENAAALLVTLCSIDQMYLVEAQKHRVKGKLTVLLQHGTDLGKEMAKQLLEKIEIYHKGQPRFLKFLNRLRNLRF